MSDRPESEIYRDGFRDGVTTARRSIEIVEDTFKILGVNPNGDILDSLRGIIEALESVTEDESNLDRAIAHFKALQAENT